MKKEKRKSTLLKNNKLNIKNRRKRYCLNMIKNETNGIVCRCGYNMQFRKAFIVVRYVLQLNNFWGVFKICLGI